MDAVGESESGVHGRSFKEEGIKRDSQVPGDAAVDGLEPFAVGPAVVGGKLHAAENGPGAGTADLAHDRREIFLRMGGIQPPQAVVGAQGDHHDRRGGTQDPVHPLEPAGGGVAGDPGVDRGPGNAVPVEKVLETRGVGRLLVETVAGGQAVPEEDDGGARGILPEGPEGKEKKGKEDPRKDPGGSSAQAG